MLDNTLFEFAKIYCANDYIMAYENLEQSKALTFIENNNLRVDNCIFKPATNQIRLCFLPCLATNQLSKYFNIKNPSVGFLHTLWELDNDGLRSSIIQYIKQTKSNYDNLEENEKNWISSVILGGKE